MPREKSYPNQPVVVVFKTSNRSNARTKMKVFRSKNIDEVLNSDNNLPGVLEDNILSIGIGEMFIEQYKEKYNL